MFLTRNKNNSRFSIYKHLIRLLFNVSLLSLIFSSLICFSFFNSLTILEYLLYPFFQIIKNNENIYFISSNLLEVVRVEFKVIYNNSVFLFFPFLITQFLIFTTNITKEKYF